MRHLFTLNGIVDKGKNRGKTFGYPTANFKLEENIPEGIYAARVIIEGKVYQSATFVGAATTFNETQVNVESYILDFNASIYGKEIRVELLKKIRDNITFSSQQALIEQMDKDVIDIRTFFANLK